MKKRVCKWGFAILFGATLAITVPAGMAQDQNPEPPAGGPPANRQMDPNRQAKMLATRLKLTPDQEKQIVPILTDRQQQFESLRNDSSLSGKDRREKMRTIREESEGKIKAVLTDEQKQAYDRMQQQMRERMRERRGQGSPDQTGPGSHQ